MYLTGAMRTKSVHYFYRDTPVILSAENVQIARIIFGPDFYILEGIKRKNTFITFHLIFPRLL